MEYFKVILKAKVFYDEHICFTMHRKALIIAFNVLGAVSVPPAPLFPEYQNPRFWHTRSSCHLLLLVELLIHCARACAMHFLQTE